MKIKLLCQLLSKIILLSFQLLFQLLLTIIFPDRFTRIHGQTFDPFFRTAADAQIH